MHSKENIQKLMDLATANHENGNLDRAEELYDQIITLDPKHFDAKKYKAQLLSQEERFDECRVLLKECYEKNKDDIDMLASYAFSLYQAGKLNDAKKMYEALFKKDPDHANALLQYSSLLCCLDQFSPAVIATCRRLVELQPGNPSTHYHLGKMLLYGGQLQEGWRECEWRWKQLKYTSEHKREFSQPYWDGSALGEKTLVIEFEQGVGDSIQFCRYLFLLFKDNPKAKFILTVEKNLFDLFNFIFHEYSNIDIVQMQKNVVMTFYYDYHFPLMSFPDLYQTSLDNIPADIPYLQAQKPKNYKDNDDELVIGIAWFSKAPHIGKRRSIALEKLAALNISKKIKWVDLQYGNTQAERDAVEKSTGWKINHDNDVEQLDSLMEFVDQVAGCDLIISIDNTTVHVAGAMGKEVWVMLPMFCDFRWMTKRTDSPWYPSMTLFRQAQYNCWDDVIKNIKQKLTSILPIF